MDRATQIPGDVISGQVEVLDQERTIVGVAVCAQGVGLYLSEIANERNSRRVEAPAQMEELDRPGRGLLPGALTHRPELKICHLKLVAIRVPLVEGFVRRHTARRVDDVPQAYDGIVPPTEPDPAARASRPGEGVRP